MTNETQTTFQEFISLSILYSNSQEEQKSYIDFGFIGHKAAEQPTDLHWIQLELGGALLDQYSDYRINPEQYISNLRTNFNPEVLCVN